MKIRKTLLFTAVAFLSFYTGCDDSSTPSPCSADQNSFFPSDNLETACKYAMAYPEGGQKGRALLIWHDGDIILEEYEGAFDGQKLHTLFSGSKSFAGMLAAFAVEDGLFTFNTTLGELIPEWDPESERGQVTIRQLLSLTSGIETASAGTILTAEEFLSVQMEYERGSTFAYGPTPFYILSWIFVETLGIHPIDYLDEKLFKPLGVVRGEWANIDLNYPNLAFGGNYPALDWLQIGIMLMNGGTLDGTEIIPEDLLSELLKPSDAAPMYGVTFWLNQPVGQAKAFTKQLPKHVNAGNTDLFISDLMPQDLYMMSGLFGQKLYICPSLNIVIVRYGKLLGGMEDEEFFSLLMEGVDLSTLQ